MVKSGIDVHNELSIAEYQALSGSDMCHRQNPLHDAYNPCLNMILTYGPQHIMGRDEEAFESLVHHEHIRSCEMGTF